MVKDIRVWLNAKEAAEYLRIGYGSLKNRTSKGQIPFHKLGNLLRFDKAELDNFIRRQGKTCEQVEADRIFT